MSLPVLELMLLVLLPNSVLKTECASKYRMPAGHVSSSLEPADISGPHTLYYEQFYQQLNPQGLTEVNASIAAQFLKASSIDVIWELADYRRAGSLDKRGAYIAFKLVAAVQQGLPLQPAVITAQLAQPPQFNLGGQPPSTAFQRSNSVLSKSPSIVSGGGPVSPSQVEWDIDLAEQQKYDAIFQSLNPVNGRLSGEAVRPVLLNSQLPHTHLAKIWELSDIDKDGQLDRYEMYVALHLVYKCLQNADLPDRLPISLVHPAKRSMLGAMAVEMGPSMVGNQAMPPSRRTSGQALELEDRLQEWVSDCLPT
uniref:Uncharacterized protein n=1 Tax=Ditylenchus dipsaci TaxID=166011 RepID=A0A915CPJ3_9BILA